MDRRWGRVAVAQSKRPRLSGLEPPEKSFSWLRSLQLDSSAGQVKFSSTVQKDMAARAIVSQTNIGTV